MIWEYQVAFSPLHQFNEMTGPKEKLGDQVVLHIHYPGPRPGSELIPGFEGNRAVAWARISAHLPPGEWNDQI